MKKLMFAAAVMACIGLNAEITSQNVVGYAQTGAVKGSKIMGAQFAGVGSEKAIDLSTVKVTGYTGETQADLYAQTLDEYGRGGITYSYYDVPGEYTGWMDGETPIEEGMVLIQPGSGFWVDAPSTDWALQTAGEVPTTDIAVTLVKGSKMVVNSTPVPMDLSKIAVTGYTGETQADVYAQTLDEYGRGGITYSYYDVPGEYTGWMDGETPIEEGMVFLQPGEGYWVDAPSAAWGLVLPGVEL